MTRIKSPFEWKRKVEGVCWQDVWEWLLDIEQCHGLQGRLVVYPPIGSGRDVYGSLVLELYGRDANGRQLQKHVAYCHLPAPDKATPADVALRMVVNAQMTLERDAWAAERAAAGSERMF